MQTVTSAVRIDLDDFVRDALPSLLRQTRVNRWSFFAHAHAQNQGYGSMLSVGTMVADQFIAQLQGTAASSGLMRLRSSSCATSLIVIRDTATAQLGSVRL